VTGDIAADQIALFEQSPKVSSRQRIVSHLHCALAEKRGNEISWQSPDKVGNLLTMFDQNDGGAKV
jgi:hypothetical protein